VTAPAASCPTASIARRSGGEILFDYRMIERDGRWKIRDVVVDGVSVAANYRAQIAGNFANFQLRGIESLHDHALEHVAFRKHTAQFTVGVEHANRADVARSHELSCVLHSG